MCTCVSGLYCGRSFRFAPGHEADGGVGAPHVVGGPAHELRVVGILHVRHLKPGSTNNWRES